MVFVDFSDISRVRDFVVGHEEYFSTNPVISIDHHINDNVPSNWIINSDPTAMSACEVIYELTYPWWSAIYDAQIATYLYL
ncbi:TPA: hypothetical protein DEP21_03350 [Patescibacteria group bacterium]|nr:hypothetical protein [Candidatus Gracilibacteria bacterium]